MQLLNGSKVSTTKIIPNLSRLDIKEFYASITEETLDAAIVFAKTNINISNDDMRKIKHSRSSLLFRNTEAWKKKSECCFDVTMGRHDGAEVYKLVGIFILSHLTKPINQNNVGLYRNDGLIVLKNLNGQQTDKRRKSIIQVSKLNSKGI